MLAANENLETDVQVAKRQLETTKSELVELGQVRDNLDIELAAALLRISEAESLADAQSGIAKQLEADNKALTEQLAEAVSERDAVERDALETRARLETELAASRQAAKQLQSELDTQTADAAEAEQERRKKSEELESLLAQARSELQETETRLKQSETNVAELQSRLETLQSSSSETESNLRDELRRALAHRLSLVNDLNASREGREAAEEAARTALRQREAANRAIAELDRKAAELNEQIRALQASLELSEANEASANVEISSLGTRLNSALARAAAENARRLEAERERNELLEKDAQQLERFQSEFLSGLRDKIEGRDGVRIEGDRFVFSSEVLFESNDATLSEEGKAEIGNIAGLLKEIAKEFPDNIDWIVRVDGHTDADPIRDGGFFKDNWELSQGRSLSVVRYMIDEFEFEPNRLAATGFGQHRPIAAGDSEEAKSRNRRIELKLTGS